MNKYYFDGVIVVEGKSDISFLSSFLIGKFYLTNGCDINKERLKFLKLLSNNNKIIVITDPDIKGNEIRRKINEEIKGIINIELDKNYCKKKDKIGLAESSMDYIFNKLREYNLIVNKKTVAKPLYLRDIMLINEKNNLDIKNLIENSFNVKIYSNKELIKVLYLMDFDIEKLTKFIEEYKDGK